jgi:hypothetical protein
MEKLQFNFFHIHIEVRFTLVKPPKNNPANILSLSTRVPPFSNSKTMMTNFPSGLGIKQELCDDALYYYYYYYYYSSPKCKIVGITVIAKLFQTLRIKSIMTQSCLLAFARDFSMSAAAGAAVYYGAVGQQSGVVVEVGSIMR